MPKALNTSLDARQALRHNPLAEDYLSTSPRKRGPGKNRSTEEANADEHFVDSRSSQKILQIGKLLTEEDHAERQLQTTNGPSLAFAFGSRFQEDEWDYSGEQFDDGDDTWGDEEDDVENIEEVEVEPTDLELFNRFNPSFDDPILKSRESDEMVQSTSLADLILEKIAAFEAGQAPQANTKEADEPPDGAVELPAKVVEAFSK
jgi:essential nuclear protein 1